MGPTTRTDVATSAALLQLASALRELASRVVGLPDLLATCAGFRPPKKLRLRVMILRDRDGRPVAGKEDVEEAVAEARRVLDREARVELVPVDGRLIETLEEPAPEGALEFPCSKQGLWRADLGRPGEYFRRRRARNARFRLLGYGAPITVFVVRDVVGKCGCSLGPLGDYVTIDGGGLTGRTRRILAHELGHSCGLPHSGEEDKLMWPRSPGERLTRWQQAVFRSSRHVTYL